MTSCESSIIQDKFITRKINEMNYGMVYQKNAFRI